MVYICACRLASYTYISALFKVYLGRKTRTSTVLETVDKKRLGFLPWK
jgi:hypothetical protein